MTKPYFKAPTTKVYVDGAEVDSAAVLRITRSMGGASGDVCVLRLTGDEAPQDKYARLEVQTVTIVEESEEEGPKSPIEPPPGMEVVGGEGTEASKREQVVFWGQTSGVAVSLDNGTFEFEARIGRHHFGKPLDGMVELGKDEKEKTLPRDVVFNPEIDGRTRGNMNEEKSAAGDEEGEGQADGEPRDEEAEGGQAGGGDETVNEGAEEPIGAEDGGEPKAEGDAEKAQYRTFLDYERIRTAKAREKAGYSKSEDEDFEKSHDERLWTLPEAVLYLCGTLNKDQTFIANPKREEIEEVLSDSKELLRGVQMRMGWYLNECLDQLLHPFGYTWHVEPPEDKEGKPKIKVVERGQGPEVALMLQPLGEVLDPETSNIGGGAFTSGWQTLINQVRAVGGYKRQHVSLKLKPAWDKELDTLDEDDLRKDSDSYQGNPERQRVGRDWVFNEAGDYCGLRDGQDEPASLKDYFGHEVTPRRRRLEPGIVRRPDGAPLGEDGIVLRIRYTESDDWIYPDGLNDFGAWAVLDQEIGIRFTGNHVPSELWAAFKKAKAENGALPEVEVTGVIVDDERLEYVAKRRDESPQTKVIEELIDTGERFQLRKLHKDSLHYEDRDSLDVDEQDDEEAIKKFAERLRDAWDQADIAGQFEVIGLVGQALELGMVVTRLDGRNIQLDAQGEGAGRKVYPQIVSITRDYVRQGRTIQLQTFRDETGL